MKDLLANFNVGTTISTIQNDNMKKRIVIAARDNWENYFSRLFPVKVSVLGVSHRSIRLLKVVKASGITPKHLHLLRSYRYTSSLNSILHHMARFLPIHSLYLIYLDIFLLSYVTDEKSLLSFGKGDIIKLQQMEGVQPGWLFGTIGGRSGLFPEDLTQPSAAPDYHSQHLARRDERRKSMRIKVSMPGTVQNSVYGSAHDLEVHSAIAEFASKYFRYDSRIIMSLFIIIIMNNTTISYLQYIYSKVAPKLVRISDCRLHRSNCTQGWQLLSLLAGFLPCSAILQPYIQQHLKEIAQDNQHPHRELASMSLDNLERTLIFGGRRNIPSNAEMEAIDSFTVRLIYTILSVDKTCTHFVPYHYLHGCINCIFLKIDVSDMEEVKDFSILANGMVRPLYSEDYLFDILPDNNSTLLSLRRVMWRNPLSINNGLFVEFHYNQLLSDYRSGQLMLAPTAGSSSSVQVEMKEYLPPREGLNVNVEEIHSFCLGQVVGMQSLRPEDAKIKFIEVLTTLPLFGTNIFLAQKVSQRGCPSPCMVSISQEGVLFLHPKTQVNFDFVTICPEFEPNYSCVLVSRSYWVSAKELCHILALTMKS
uniref:MyTH4 domain-containing protein n=1 Tax=Mola mola TaxID=94237 RepID=A0A3Q3X8F6_MOLML